MKSRTFVFPVAEGEKQITSELGIGIQQLLFQIFLGQYLLDDQSCGQNLPRWF